MTTVRVQPVEVEISWVRRTETAFMWPPRVTARFVLQYEEWQRARDWGTFHLDGVGEPPGFEPDRRVELRARLRPTLAREFPENEGAIADRINDATDPIRHTEAWFATGVLQTVPRMEDLGEYAETSTGRKTRWADPQFGPWRGDAGEGTRLLNAVVAYLEAEAWSYDRVNDEFVRFDVLADDQQRWTVLVLAEEDARRCTIYSGFPDRVPDGKRADAALTLAQWNYGLDRGAFVLDPADGELRFRTRVLPDHESFGEALNENIAAMNEVYDDLATLTGNGDEE